jgi:DedD protein
MPEPATTALDDARKRARRRLVGAIVLALVAAVVVPIFLESDPKPLGPDVQIQIPAVDDSKFQNRLTPPAKGGTPEKAAAEGTKPSAGTEPAKDAQAPSAATSRSETSSAPTESPAAGSASPAGEATPSAPATAQSMSSTQSPTEAKAGVVKTEPAAETTRSEKDGKQAAKAEKAADKAAAKPAQKAAEKAAEKRAVADKAAEKARDKAAGAEAPPEPPHTLGTATLNTAPPPVSPKSGDFVVQLGAFVDKAVATDLAAKAGEQGYPVFLEPVTTKSGPVQRVRVGPFATREAADAAAAKLAAAGFTAVARPR